MKYHRHYEVVISRKRRADDPNECYDFEVISEFNPKSIFEYLNPPNGKSDRRTYNKLLNNARKHLSAIGWKIWSKIRNGNDEWRYESPPPREKTYYSLNTACEAIANGVESNDRVVCEGNVGRFTGFKRRKRRRNKRRRVIECGISDDDGNLWRRSGFRGNVDEFLSENEVVRSGEAGLDRKGTRLRRRSGVESNVDGFLSENEVEMSDQEVLNRRGTRLRRRSGVEGNVDEFLSENEVEMSDQEVLNRRGTRLRRKNGFRGNVEEKIGIFTELLSENEVERSDQEGLDRRGTRLRRKNGFRGNVGELLSENEVEMSDEEVLNRQVTRLRRKSRVRKEKEGIGCLRELLSENESDDEGLDCMVTRLRSRRSFRDNVDDDLEVKKEKKEDIVYTRSKNELRRSRGHIKVDGDEKVGCLTPLATRFDDEKSNEEDSDDEDCSKKVNFRVKLKKRTIRSCLDGQNTSRMLRSSKRVRKIGSSSVSQVPRTILSWLIENNAVVPRSKVYFSKGSSNDSSAEGRIARDGIRCSCCQELFSLSGFQAHVAGYNIRRPAENIYLENGKSLMSCQVELMRQRTRSVDRPVEQVKETKTEMSNDCVCTICQYGGDLILCDRCPSSFHANCLNLEGVPDGEWFCPSCCCVVCGINLVDDSLLRCYQCERRYHSHCNKGREMDNPGENWFCCLTCEKMHWGLQQLLGKPILVGQGNLTWTLVKPMQYDAEDHEHGDMVSVAENYSKLSVALEVMHECFEPVKDLQTKRDLVEDVVFCRESNLNRLNFKGFYTVLLERNDELIATALLRIYGENVAEIPLIGTRVQHRRLGMCRVLMNEIEKNLLNLGVQKLVLPAAPSVVNTWTTSFGFSTIEESDRPQFLGYTFLDFQDTVMCQKLLRKPPISRLHLSRDMSSVRQSRKNVEGRSIVVYNEVNSSMSEVFHEDQRQGSDTVDQGTQLNDTPSPTEFMDQRRVERDKSSLKFYIRKQDIKPKPLVSQTNYSKLERLEVRCR